MKRKAGKVLLVCSALFCAVCARAQHRFETNVGADIVSGYEWRGQDLGNAGFQPAVSVAYRGFSLAAWGNIGIDSEDTREIDLTLGYSAGGFSVSVTDYWFDAHGGDANYLNYKARGTAHVFEAQAGYDFGVCALNWYTNFAGADGLDKKGRRAYSSYFNVVAPFRLGSLNWKAGIGATPWATTSYADAGGFAVCSMSLEAERELGIADGFAIPVFARLTLNPASENVYFVFGVSL